MNGMNDQWLVKSANRVMGPFKLSEIITGLQLKHFTIMDEISAPYGRWILIRDEASLQAAVKEVRNRSDSVENTATLTHTLSQSMGMTSGDWENTSVRGTLPAPSSLVVDKKANVSPVRKSSMMSSIVVFCLVVILAGGGFYYFQSRKKQKDAVQDGLAQVSQLKAQGFYDRAYALMTKLKGGDKANSTLDLEMALYQISIQNQNVVGRKSLEKIMNQLDSKESQPAAYTAIALSYLNEGDFKNASEAINQALALNATFLPAEINKALIDLKSGKPEVAEQSFEPIMSNINNGTVVLGSTLASIEVNRKGLMPMRILPVLVQMLDEYLKNNFEYQQEAYLLKAYIHNFLGKMDLRNQAIIELLNSDLESGQGHRFDLLVDRSFLNWKNLLPYCQTVVDSGSDSGSDSSSASGSNSGATSSNGNNNLLLGRVFLAYCLSKAGMDLEAKKLILQVESEAPRNPHVAAMKAYIMRLLGQESESQASLGIALSDKSILSAWLMKSKYCEAQKNDTCVQEALTQLMTENPRSLPAYVGMARLELRRGNKKEASDWINKGLALSQTFIPYWEVKNSL